MAHRRVVLALALVALVAAPAPAAGQLGSLFGRGMFGGSGGGSSGQQHQRQQQSQQQQSQQQQQQQQQQKQQEAANAGGANFGPAQGCKPPTLPQPQPLGVPVPALRGGQRPNFIVVLTDDQGYDDIGLHQPQRPGGRPQWVSTPNLDKFLRTAMDFDNFYVAPMCSQSRAQLLTGRDYPRTGTMLINGGYDYLNRAEATMGNVLGDAGYKTSHFGKWHNGRTLGYEPWLNGFQESWLPSAHVHLDNLMRHNGKYVQTQGLMEQDLMDKLLGYLRDREADRAPFLTFYAPHAIHQGFMRPGQGPRWQRPAPEPYKSKYQNMRPQLPGDTAEVWAMLEYLDDVLGRLFDFYDRSPLRENTYLLVMSDNGAELYSTERAGDNKLRRMPSGMQGYKKSPMEGGIRNFLGVKGPGVAAGTVDTTLLSITDVLPTLADLAGAGGSRHLPWDGSSFRQLLLGGRASGAFGASPYNQDRVVVEMAPECWSPDSVPDLTPDRRVKKPQPLLDYDRGGVDGRGFARCLAVRWRDYKWLGESGKVYRFPNTSHIELPCNEVGGAEGQRVAGQLAGAARSWFGSVVGDSHSFRKPTFQLGLPGWRVTNVLPDGAHERTPGRVQLLPNGARGFSQPGDRMCFAADVATAGSYQVNVIYTSKVDATFRVSVGALDAIQKGSAPSVAAKLPAQANLKGREVGVLRLPASSFAGQRTEICLALEATSSPGSQVFENLSNLRFSLQLPSGAFVEDDGNGGNGGGGGGGWKGSFGGGGGGGVVEAPAASNARVAGLGTDAMPLSALDWVTIESPLDDEGVDLGGLPARAHLNATDAMRVAERQAYAAAAAGAAKERGRASAPPGAAPRGADAAAAVAMAGVRARYLWPDGQGDALESMFTPYESEGIAGCEECLPDL